MAQEAALAAEGHTRINDAARRLAHAGASLGLKLKDYRGGGSDHAISDATAAVALNGARSKRASIRFGDVLGIGEYQIRLDPTARASTQPRSDGADASKIVPYGNS